MTREEFESLIHSGEGQAVEFKASFAEDDEAIRSLCVFANAKGGTVLFGITNDGRMVGVTVGANTIENFVNKVHAQTQPPLTPTVEKLDIEGKAVVAAALGPPGRGQLFYAFNTPFIRVGGTNQVMPPDQQRERLRAGLVSNPERLTRSGQEIDYWRCPDRRLHQWRYWRGPDGKGVYLCENCPMQVDKATLKAHTDQGPPKVIRPSHVSE